jgi:hypothetical protein
MKRLGSSSPDSCYARVSELSEMTFESTPCDACTMPAGVFPVGASRARNTSCGGEWPAGSRANARTSF